MAEGKHLEVKKQDKIKFKDFANEYLDLHSKVNNKSWKKSDLRNIMALNIAFSTYYLHELTPHLIEEFKAKRAKEVKPATVNRHLACLKSMFNKATVWGRYSGENPVKRVKLFKENNQRVRFLERLPQWLWLSPQSYPPGHYPGTSMSDEYHKGQPISPKRVCFFSVRPGARQVPTLPRQVVLRQ